MKNGSAASCRKQGFSFRKYFVCLLKKKSNKLSQQRIYI